MVNIKALTGIIKAFEDSTGKPLEEEKKELASEELIITGNLGEDIGADKATGIVNDIKIEIIKNNTSDTVQIADTINNITNNYNITLTPEQQKQLENLMAKIAKQDYDYKQMKDTLNGIKETVNEKLESIGEGVNKDFFEKVNEWFSSITDWFKSIFNSNDKNLGILENTNDSILGENAIIDSTSEETINISQNNENNKEGLLNKIWNWFTGLFNKIEDKESDNKDENLDSSETLIQEYNEMDEFITNEEHFDMNEENKNNENNEEIETNKDSNTNIENIEIINDNQLNDSNSIESNQESEKEPLE